ncbi:guanosine-3',5'-bis(diphosphate) 3'-pyrophosphohydrolase [Parabacteroides sp. PF5-5]|uniref:RelA/SpoT family protein n=1 Tax=unclassified Parabacteroides TaxID=2649774 RepID=UPI0024767A11|nr:MULTISPECIES: TGS domain-containing protein [unclassified Parabacteroides]MDH6306163.1 guanosine-3',5'-bis(diphosphate) 3'-pyrophosphohydrolase [Parabacteroides sp. PH5-39]MDH6317122.1 guanosine-3',5'-bis(diphosphate) 3'-pyrophosphohydrolase [Parabacteroides sp. PF5-13]MDH6320875.1 guanosine-3',5'-bis(diphosphate) 3'-pyrophosphohydrolase [Parabacteroides sp. PH5-13]MDH6324606.1 guanosine-3',5'-bis(diphosphate) 3'-pyrophosphohydrolase [Parabacteroides sp. PH5-8]MDH6328343.1 guanosine-3',5'-b
MTELSFFTPEEKVLFRSRYKELLGCLYQFLEKEDIHKMRELMQQVVVQDCYGRDKNGINGLLRNIETALIAASEIGLRRAPVIALLLYRPVFKKIVKLEEVEKQFDKDVALIISRLLKTSDLYARNTAVNSENFHRLLFSFAEDVRVILLMIADRLYMMRIGKQLTSDNDRIRLATEVSYLYAPLAHRLGFYKIKGELEDLSLKYLDPKQFAFIKKKLNETKRSRDAYIAEFIAPVQKKLEEVGFNFDIKGRTKSIHSINNKLKKQKIDFEDVYDLFAIRIILDMPNATKEKERADCWQVYSIVTAMYQPNPKRMKDWISIPKNNGYESLHATVLGPQNRWVEVQIRTRRMDEIAESGLAAHWKYKGVKEEMGLDEFLTNVRMALESTDLDPMDLMKNFKMDLYKDEIYVFTPKGELLKLPVGATVLDFAFAIHTDLGSKCVSGKVNDKNVPIRQVLHNGDTVSVVTSPAQSPKRDWLSFAATSKARIKIKQALREEAAKSADFAKEMLQRRFKNRKIEMDEGVFLRYIKKKGYKTVTDFYLDLAEEHLDPNSVIEEYLDTEQKEKELTVHHTEIRSAEEFVTTTEMEEISRKQDVLVIDKDLTGIEYKLAKCCNPIFGDEIFGFVSTNGIKIHRKSCPNEQQMRERFGYRMIDARWSGKEGAGDIVNLRIIGRDDITIVTNITSVISKEAGVTLRSLNIDTVDAFFRGHFSVLVKSTNALAQLVGKIKAVKGVKTVERLNQ